MNKRRGFARDGSRTVQHMIGEETLAAFADMGCGFGGMGLALETWVWFWWHGFSFADMGCGVVCAGHGSSGPLTALDSLQFKGLLDL